jgi:ABC-type glycerol-3-phosphate transport system permease component
VTLPLSTPALASYGAIVFIIAWNDLLTPLILNNRAEFMTLPVVIASLVGNVHMFFSLMLRAAGPFSQSASVPRSNTASRHLGSQFGSRLKN